MAPIIDKDATTKKKDSVAKKKKSKLIRPRGKRGGAKNRKASTVKAKSKASDSSNAVITSDADSTSQTHTARIARYHALEKEYHSPATTDERRAAILVEQEEMGGIDAYQDDSVFGGDKQRGGESGKWLVSAFKKLNNGIENKENVGVRYKARFQ